MKKLFVLVLALGLFTSCVGVRGNGNVKTETRNIEGFSKIDVSGAVDVFVKQGDKEELTIKADENLMEYIETSVSGGELRIRPKKNISNYKKLDVYVVMRELEGVEASGACDVIGEGKFTSKYCELDASGASDIELEIECEGLDIDVSGASDVKLSGYSEVTDIEASGSSDVKAIKLVTKRCQISSSGASGVEIEVEKKLEVDASGASNVRYKGNPKEVNRSTSGASSVKSY